MQHNVKKINQRALDQLVTSALFLVLGSPI